MVETILLTRHSNDAVSHNFWQWANTNKRWHAADTIYCPSKMCETTQIACSVIYPCRLVPFVAGNMSNVDRSWKFHQNLYTRNMGLKFGKLPRKLGELAAGNIHINN